MSKRPNWPKCPKCETPCVAIVEICEVTRSWYATDACDDPSVIGPDPTGIWIFCDKCRDDFELEGIFEADPKWWEEVE